MLFIKLGETWRKKIQIKNVNPGVGVTYLLYSKILISVGVILWNNTCSQMSEPFKLFFQMLRLLL